MILIFSSLSSNALRVIQWQFRAPWTAQCPQLFTAYSLSLSCHFTAPRAAILATKQTGIEGSSLCVNRYLPVRYHHLQRVLSDLLQLSFASFFCPFMGVKLGLQHWERKVCWGYLRRIFGPKRDEVAREWRRIHNKELYDLYSSSNNFLVMK